MKISMQFTATLLMTYVCLSASVNAADEQGRFMVKGGGRIGCEHYLTALETKGPEFISLAGWIEGFITYANQQEQDTFDLVPWQSTELLMSAVANHCRQNPEKSFHQSAYHVLQGVKTGRLKSKSEPVNATVADQSVVLYADIVRRLQQKLKLRGLLTGDPTGIYDKETIDAVREFQRVKKLPETGLPDQMTLAHLF
ncbi:peptidoglycan-binding domain-containing protein [Methylicorpusculum sp.]|uniref:peptidoglycan-binding domain-containing protein n=1 Tax=Methylicorpusculum sp. TaxID=2713644 RepID=UPI00272F5E75|nr:peptidoglycan-binding domain-containing protein [Methylicorpusculum sp.]MDP2180041.1 peptidoglycan-binding domain-containing protein [Methylicorpusculum sp.]MDP3528280.1 peptidoglycan-binding domain-containing protein [Methylicorpusculum sp.]MDZ4150273.1 peptidoglycan-binding domain-containing protein [Methylicorpusculum sp.]